MTHKLTLIFLTTLCLAATPGSAQLCGDCDDDGDVDILDSLKLAQGAAGTLTVLPIEYARCDVDSSATITVLDALFVAQTAAGLPVTLMCPSGNTPPVVSAVVPRLPATGDVTVDYNLADAESDMCSITVEFSTDSGTTFAPATGGPGGDGTTGLMSSPSAVMHTFVWDSLTDVGMVATSGSSVVLHISPDDGMGPGTPGQSAGFDVSNGISYSNDIEPTILMSGGGTPGCMNCHSAGSMAGGLVLDTHADLMIGGFSGAVVIPGDPSMSRIICKLEGGPCGSPMPSGGRPAWSPAMIQTFRDWISQGALDN